MSRRICVVTGSRAEYGLLRWVMEGIRNDASMQLQVVVTGMHLASEYGLTYRELERDGFCIDCKVDMLLASDSATAVGKSMGLGLLGFADALDQLRPDLLLVLGDRFEIFSAVAAALVARIPVAHIHGGESTEGAFDEAIRHSITKMSHLHFVAAESYRRRVIQLGEQPDKVFMVGGLGVDCAHRVQPLERAALEASLGFRFGPRNLLVTFHPVTLEALSSGDQMAELLAALAVLDDTHIVFTMPNADPDSRVLFDMIRAFAAGRPHVCVHTSLGQQRYLSCIRQVDAVVGNSSSGLLEVPSFGKPTINIGDRQRGRLKAASVIDCEPQRDAILAALRQASAAAFRQRLVAGETPYGGPGASDRIVGLLRTLSLDGLLKKRFHDLVDARSA